MVSTRATEAVALQYRSLGARLVERGVEDRPEVDKPSEKDDPEDRGEDELNDRDKKPALEQLPEPRDEETAQCRNDVAGGALTCHGNNFRW